MILRNQTKFEVIKHDKELTMRLFRVYILLIVIGLLHSCGKASFPKPYGYYRVDLPPHSYRLVDTLNLPYTFEMPKNAVLANSESKEGKYWVDIIYPKLNATIYCSYKSVNGNLTELLEDTRKIVYKHTIRADVITERPFIQYDKKAYGILYDLKGNTASSVQFVMTDSLKNFFRGALYFNNIPNKDSIAPMSEYVREDIMHIMESFQWKK